ncbi:MAG: proline--tRNA ligase [bacterium]
MQWTESLINTLWQVPSEAEISSHKLMLRAGLIKKLAAGIYIFMPLGLKVLRKIENIVREEMDTSGALELLMPTLQPEQLWQESGRWNKMGKEMMKVQDRHKRQFGLGPTHEEIVTDIIRKEVKSYRQLPVTLYQIQTKFRDEIRPRFGVIRAREFTMKDAYSFDRDIEGLNKNYKKMYDVYCKIFDRCALKYQIVEAESGIMGGDVSHEFMALADSGEDTIVLCPSCGYSASMEKAEAVNIKQKIVDKQKEKPIKEIDTPEVKTIKQLTELLKISPKNLVKTLIYKTNNQLIAVLIRGDHEVNITKLLKLIKCEELELADSDIVERITGAPVGFTGPVGMKGKIKIVADNEVLNMRNFITGANKKDTHLLNVNIGRDFKIDISGDIRFITESDQCPKCSGHIKIKKGIELGHIFKLGTKYSKSMGAGFLDKHGKEKTILMGCYGIGISRIIAAVIEQNNDENGIIWPKSIAPHQVEILPLNVNDKETMQIAKNLYKKFLSEKIEAIIDDRDERPGIKFKDADLIGIPIRITISPQKAKDNIVEIHKRDTGENKLVNIDDLLENLTNVQSLV